MSDAIEKVDLRDASEQLRDKIKLAFTEVISDEQWKAMIEGELKKFTTGEVINRGTYNERKIDSGLTTVCSKVFSECFEAKLREYMKDADFSKEVAGVVRTWLEQNQQNMVRDAILSMLTSNLTQVMQDMTQGAIFTHQNDPQAHRY